MQDKKKKILHLVEAFGGGVFTFLVELSNSMSEDYEIVIAYAKRNQTPENFKEYFNKNIKFIEVKNFTRSIGVKDFKACKEVKQIIKQENPDIVHMHSSKAGIIGRLVISSKNKKLFYTPHGYSFLKQDDSAIKRFIYKSIEKLAAMYKRRCKTIACSKGEYNETLKLTKNCTYVNNGVNTYEIDEIIKDITPEKIDTSNLKICTVGRIGFQKNPKLFNELAERFSQYTFTWIGDGELRESLTSKNIKITGWASREDVLKQICKNDIFILPSLWEGLPIALLEAMYLGKICIVSNVIGNRDVIKNGENGFVCDNLEEYENIIKSISEEKVDINKMEKNVIDDVNNNYTITNMCKKYKEIYN